MLVRRGWMLAGGLLLGLATAWFLSGLSASASSSFRVRTLEQIQSPYPEARLALTYSRLIPENPEIIAALARETGLSHGEVEEGLSMSTLPETNVLFARFTANDKETALIGLRALSEALPSTDDRAGTRLGRTVTPISDPVIAGGVSRNKTLLLRGLAGLMVAVSLALTPGRR